jgi:putative IMPACT (imprinted ancient) family translation regulator
VVVRWFGGVKLGTGGLSRAYRQTASETIARADIVDHYVYSRIRVAASFERLSDLYRLVAPPEILLIEEKFGESNEFVFDVRASKREDFVATLAARRLTPL